jgi:hypothetical protein
MNVSAMVRRSIRVAAFVALAALVLQAACTISPVAYASVPQDVPGGSGCHESMPATPQVPTSGHICCSGDHSPDALLSAAVTPVPAAFAGYISLPIVSFIVPITSFADNGLSVSRPPGQLALRI